MMTEKQRVKALQTAERKLSRCDGDCQHCEKLHLYTAQAPGCLTYAWGCNVLPTELFDAISDSVKQLHATAVETIKFELN